MIIIVAGRWECIRLGSWLLGIVKAEIARRLILKRLHHSAS
jgi:hypothetical protein